MTNVAASIRAKLKNLSQKENIDFQTIVIRYFHERLLYRLSISDFNDKFILKGGDLLYYFHQIKYRPTLDIDFLGKNIHSDLNKLKTTFTEIVDVNCEDDGVQFDAKSLTAVSINEDANYTGARLHLEGCLGQIKNTLQIDIGFGDIVTPQPATLDYPVLLIQSSIPKLKAYTIESVIAEKFQTMIELSALNSRMKDFFDIYMLIKTEKIDKHELGNAIAETFKNRNTLYQEDHLLFNEKFIDTNKIKQWNAFLKKAKIKEQLSFIEIYRTIVLYMHPYWKQLKKRHA